jgi:predicted nucleic acid-binding protein
MSNFPTEERGLIIDTSVVINLHWCTYGAEILSAIPNEVAVPEIVAAELDNERSRRTGEHGFLERLIAAGTVEIVNLTEAEYKVYEELVSGSPSLDDGEAATVAVAVSRNLFAIIDEKKGRRVALSLTKEEPGCSLDLFRHATILAKLGNEHALEALFRSLRDARMRIATERAEEVIALLGIDRAKECKSLPGYKERFGAGTS